MTQSAAYCRFRKLPESTIPVSLHLNNIWTILQNTHWGCGMRIHLMLPTVLVPNPDPTLFLTMETFFKNCEQ